MSEPDTHDELPGLLQPISCRHREESCRLILQAAEQTAHDRAIVLGAGECREIPMAELAGMFAEVTLNDIFPDPLEEALASLVASRAETIPAVREKMRIEVADLTGLVEPLMDTIGRRLSKATDPASAARVLSDSLRVRRPHQPIIA